MIEIKELHKSFDGIPILNNISTKFDQGKTNLIIGQREKNKMAIMVQVL